MNYYVKRHQQNQIEPFLGLPWELSTASAQYQEAVLSAWDRSEWEMAPLQYERDGHSVYLYYTERPVTIDGVTINATARFEQQLANLADMTLLTPAISDEIYKAADHKLEPRPQKPDSWMGTVAAMQEHSKNLAADLEGLNGTVADGGKDWALFQGRVGNYGWHRPSEGGQVWQPFYTGHGLQHSDYSQVVRLVGPEMRIDGEVIPTRVAYTDPRFASALGSAGGDTVPLA